MSSDPYTVNRYSNRVGQWANNAGRPDETLPFSFAAFKIRGGRTAITNFVYESAFTPPPEEECPECELQQLLNVNFVTDVDTQSNWNFALNDFGEIDVLIPDEVNPDMGPDNEEYTTIPR